MTCPQDGHTALHGAAFIGDTDLVQLLLEKGADASTRSNVSQNMSIVCIACCKKGMEASYCIALY